MYSHSSGGRVLATPRMKEAKDHKRQWRDFLKLRAHAGAGLKQVMKHILIELM